MAFCNDMQDIFLKQSEIFFPISRKNFRYGFPFMRNDLFVKVKKRKVKFLTDLFAPVCFA